MHHAYQLAANQVIPIPAKLWRNRKYPNAQKAFAVLSDLDKRSEYDRNLPPLMTEPPNVSISTIFSRPTLQRIDEHQLVYSLIELKAPQDVNNRNKLTLNLCLVIDRSTSMQGERMDTVKRTAIEIIHQLQPDDTVSIITFSDRADVLISAEHRPEDRFIESQIYSIQAGGGTEIYRGLEAGFFEIRRKSKQESCDHIILLTDGRTYGDEIDCLQLADQAAAHGVGISCLGIGHDWNDKLLDSLTLRTGGSTMFVSQPAEIRHLLRQKIRGLYQIYADRSTLELHGESSAQLQYAFRQAPDPAPLATTSPILLGIIPIYSELTLIFEFNVLPIPAAANQIVLSEGLITLELPNQIEQKIILPINLSLPVSDSPDPQPPPTKILQSVSRLTLYRMQEHAQQSLEEGKIGQASRYLNNLATQLFSHGEYKLARTVLEETENLPHNSVLSEEGKKRIKYGTRALLIPAKTSKESSGNQGGGRES